MQEMNRYNSRMRSRPNSSDPYGKYDNRQQGRYNNYNAGDGFPGYNPYYDIDGSFRYDLLG